MELVVSLAIIATLVLPRTSLCHENMRNLAEKVKEHVGIM
jgi:hypothetical protein